MEVDSTLARSQQGRGYSNLEVLLHSNCLLVLCGTVGFFAFVVCLAVWMATSGNLTGFWLFVFAVFAVLDLICWSVVGWQIHLAMIDRDEKLKRVKQTEQDIALRQRVRQLAERADRQGDSYKLVVNDKGLTLEVIRSAMNARQQAGRVVESSEQLALPPAQEDTTPLPLPKAPAFWDMVHLITTNRMPLCFVVDDDAYSQTYMQTVPAFGTILDLLSLAVIGKPGRGKTVLLIYYACMLLACGAEVHIFDPHGVMGELQLLHGRRLPAMPETARIYYYDTKEAMARAVPELLNEMQDRDKLYRPHMESNKLVSRKVKHPLLILADELPILADFDDQYKAEYKKINRERKAEGESKLEVPLLGYLIRRTVLEARKWYMFFIGSSQSIDASILPTKVTDALNSRIVFFNSDRKARMVGLEADVIKKMLPVIRRAGPGMTIYDCARWDTPKIGAIPNITVEDMLRFLGLTMDDLTEMWIAENAQTPENGTLSTKETEIQGEHSRSQNTTNEPVESGDGVPNDRPMFPMMGEIQAAQFRAMYPLVGSVDGCLDAIEGCNHRHRQHARMLIEQYGLKKRA